MTWSLRTGVLPYTQLLKSCQVICSLQILMNAYKMKTITVMSMLSAPILMVASSVPAALVMREMASTAQVSPHWFIPGFCDRPLSRTTL